MANSWTTAGGTIQILFGCSGISSPPPVLFTLSLWDVTHHAQTPRNDCWFLPDIVLCTEKNVFADSLSGLFMTSGSTLCTTEPTAEISKLLLGEIRTKWVPKKEKGKWEMSRVSWSMWTLQDVCQELVPQSEPCWHFPMKCCEISVGLECVLKWCSCYKPWNRCPNQFLENLCLRIPANFCLGCSNFYDKKGSGLVSQNQMAMQVHTGTSLALLGHVVGLLWWYRRTWGGVKCCRWSMSYPNMDLGVFWIWAISGSQQ